MFSALHIVIPRWVKSRHTPTRDSKTLRAEYVGEDVPYSRRIESCTQSEIACTRPHPGGTLPKRSNASPTSRSDSQYRLGSTNIRASSGSSLGATSQADHTCGSGSSDTFIDASKVSTDAPAARSTRRQELPNWSR